MKYIVYCDGACRGNGKEESKGGWAAVVSSEEKLTTISGKEKNTTNNKMELMAAIEALKSIDIKPFDEVIVNTDSAYVHNCYKNKWYVSWERNGWVNSKKEPVKNKELWEELIPYFKNSQITFEKVKGHSGDEFNELVDKLAVAEALSVQ